MKRITWIVAFAAATTASAYAQQTYEPTVPRGLSESRVEPSGTLAPPVRPRAPSAVVDPAVPQLAMNVRRHQRDADARQCLQLATNTQIHRCAERYRSRASRAQVSKASLQKQATRSAGPTVIVRETTVVTTQTGPGKVVEAPKPPAGAPPAAATSAAPPAVAAAPRPDQKTTVTTPQPAPKAVDPVKTTK